MRGGCYSIEEEPVFNGMEVDLKLLSDLVMLWILGGYRKVIGINANFGVVSNE